MKKRLLPSLAVVSGVVALANLPVNSSNVDSEGEVFGRSVRALSPAEMAESKGGVGLTVTKPRASQTHYIDNPRFIADVFNFQSQGQTTLYLHHGTSKTGTRTVPTPAPGYGGHIVSRFKHLGGTADLVVKYFDTADRALKVARVVPAQKMSASVRLLRLVVHNVKTSNPITHATVNETTVGGDVIARAVDSQNENPYSAISDSIDAILSQCPKRRRTQFQLVGSDNGVALHTIDTGTENCANLEIEVTYEYPPGTDPRDPDAKKEIIYSTAAAECMLELLDGAEQADPNLDSFHVYIVKDLMPDLNGFISSPAGGSVIRESEFSGDPSWAARLLLHEVGHGFGLGDTLDTNSRCVGLLPEQRALMCEAASAGTQLNTAECERFYTEHPTALRDHN